MNAHPFQTTEDASRQATYAPHLPQIQKRSWLRPRYFALLGLSVGLVYLFLNASLPVLLIAGVGTGLALGLLISVAVWSQNHSRW